MLPNFWAWGFQPCSREELFQKNLARLPVPSFSCSACTLIFTSISAFGDFCISDCTTVPLHSLSYGCIVDISISDTLELRICQGWTLLKKIIWGWQEALNMSKNRLGLLMYLVPCFQTAACWEPHPSVFSFFFHLEYVLSTIWFTYKIWNNHCWRENLMLFRPS